MNRQVYLNNKCQVLNKLVIEGLMKRMAAIGGVGKGLISKQQNYKCKVTLPEQIANYFFKCQ